MEVHTHTHSARRKWKHYLWEFIMLFLAVFCGFLAEYQLEHAIEKQRAKDFAVSLHRDLAADTTEFNEAIDNLSACIKKIDTLLSLLSGTESPEERVDQIYRLSVYAFIFPSSQANESTLQQLINSGSLRYFKNDQLVDSIKEYNMRIASLNKFNDAVTLFNIEFRKAQLKLIEINPVIGYMNQNELWDRNQRKLDTTMGRGFFKNAKLLTADGLLIKEYANWCALKKFYMANTIVYISRVKKYAVEVLRLLDI